MTGVLTYEFFSTGGVLVVLGPHCKFPIPVSFSLIPCLWVTFQTLGGVCDRKLSNGDPKCNKSCESVEVFFVLYGRVGLGECEQDVDNISVCSCESVWLFLLHGRVGPGECEQDVGGKHTTGLHNMRPDELHNAIFSAS